MGYKERKEKIVKEYIEMGEAYKQKGIYPSQVNQGNRNYISQRIEVSQTQLENGLEETYLTYKMLVEDLNDVSKYKENELSFFELEYKQALSLGLSKLKKETNLKNLGVKVRKEIQEDIRVRESEGIEPPKGEEIHLRLEYNKFPLLVSYKELNDYTGLKEYSVSLTLYTYTNRYFLKDYSKQESRGILKNKLIGLNVTERGLLKLDTETLEKLKTPEEYTYKIPEGVLGVELSSNIRKIKVLKCPKSMYDFYESNGGIYRMYINQGEDVHKNYRIRSIGVTDQMSESLKCEFESELDMGDGETYRERLNNLKGEEVTKYKKYILKAPRIKIRGVDIDTIGEGYKVESTEEVPSETTILRLDGSKTNLKIQLAGVLGIKTKDYFEDKKLYEELKGLVGYLEINSTRGVDSYIAEKIRDKYNKEKGAKLDRYISNRLFISQLETEKGKYLLVDVSNKSKYKNR